jgi:hypothetical protein
MVDTNDLANTPKPVGTGELPSSRGIFDCPTVDAPAYGVPAPPAAVRLSGLFTSACATCHGSVGEGLGVYPALPGNLNVDEFLQAVRSGRPAKGMPAFDAATWSDAEARSDFDALINARATGLLGEAAATGEATWDSTRIDAAYTAGLAAWRKPDAHGASCDSCHSPDALDLAVIGYSDSTILRRAFIHLDWADAQAVRDLIHAQRRRFNITRPCSVDWRPFQPAGEPLPGNTPAEQDHAFAEHLKTSQILVMTSRIDSLEAAEAAFEQFVEIDLRRLPIGIPLPHWTRDVFNGPDSATFNDWLTAVDVTPSRAEFLTASDQYLADPSFEHYLEMEKAAVGYTSVPGFQLWMDWFRNAAEAKRRLVLLGSHYFRMELLKRPGWLDLPKIPHPELAENYSPFATLAGMTQEFSCGDGYGDCEQLVNTFEPSQIPKFGAPPTPEAVNARFIDTTHAWWTLAELFNEPLLGSEDHMDGNFFYWTFRFPHRDIHHPFFMARIPAMRAWAHTELKGTPAFPARYKYEAKTHPLLSSALFGGQHGPLDLDSLPAMDGPNVEAGILLRANLIRMFAYLHIDLLSKGYAIEGDTTYGPDIGKELFVKYYDGTDPPPASHAGKLVKRLQPFFADPEFLAKHPALAEAEDYLTTDLQALLDQALTLVEKAPHVTPNQ